MSAKKIVNNALYYMPKPNRWQSGAGLELPVEYKKFWHEWKLQQPVAVHYIPKEGRFERNEKTGEVFPVQNVPMPLKYPKELNKGIWGGEAIVQGFTQRSHYVRRNPRFWVPKLKKSIVYSEILDKYMSVIITNRTLDLIHENYGFDHYLLKTPACDLRSELALKIKRQILVALADKTLYPNDPEKCEEIYSQYEQYLSAYTREEIEWYGLTYKEACLKWHDIKMKENEVQPLKHIFRAKLIEELKQSKIEEAEENNSVDDSKLSWISKLNPFSSSPKTQ